jgi:hypothetical protein
MRTFAHKQSQPQGRVSGPAPPKAVISAPTDLTNQLLHLQRMIGNQAVRRLLRAESNGPGAGSGAGTPAHFTSHLSRMPATSLSRMPAHPKSPIIMQTKLTLNAPGDIYEQEADRACQVEQEHENLQTERVDASSSGQTAAPPIVHEALRSPGQALDPATRAFMEPRFGHDFSHVRVHTDELAAESAAAVGALAYTVGPDVVFARAQYSPPSASRRRLLAHELAHVVQQRPGSPATLRRTPCLHGSDCKDIPGDTGRFVERIFGTHGGVTVTFGHVEVLTPDPSAPAGTPATPPPSRQGLPAAAVRKLVESSAFKLPPEASGPFIDEGLTAEAAAAAPACKDFPGGIPKGAPKDGCCMQVYPEMENRAAELLKAKSPRTAAQNAEALKIISTVLHEAEHCHFNFSPITGKKLPAEADCNLDTVVFHGPTTKFDFNVKFYLSEMSARIAEFPPYFQNFKASPTKANHDLLHQKELEIALNKDESIRGIIHGLKCACSCETVDRFTEEAVNNAMDSWPKDQAEKFLEAMARIMPSWWPKSLQKP